MILWFRWRSQSVLHRCARALLQCLEMVWGSPRFWSGPNWELYHAASLVSRWYCPIHIIVRSHMNPSECWFWVFWDSYPQTWNHHWSKDLLSHCQSSTNQYQPLWITINHQSTIKWTIMNQPFIKHPNNPCSTSVPPGFLMLQMSQSPPFGRSATGPRTSDVARARWVRRRLRMPKMDKSPWSKNSWILRKWTVLLKMDETWWNWFGFRNCHRQGFFCQFGNRRSMCIQHISTSVNQSCNASLQYFLAETSIASIDPVIIQLITLADFSMVWVCLGHSH